MKFQLKGSLSYERDYDEDPSMSKIFEEFDAVSVKAAIKKAKELLEGFYTEPWCHRPGSIVNIDDDEFQAELRIVQKVWETKFIPAVKARPATPAVPVRQARQARIVEKRIK